MWCLWMSFFSWSGHVDSTRDRSTEEPERECARSRHSLWLPGLHQLPIDQRPWQHRCRRIRTRNEPLEHHPQNIIHIIHLSQSYSLTISAGLRHLSWKGNFGRTEEFRLQKRLLQSACRTFPSASLCRWWDVHYVWRRCITSPYDVWLRRITSHYDVWIRSNTSQYDVWIRCITSHCAV